jgi:Carboxypeptidase regulatory-like domain
MRRLLTLLLYLTVVAILGPDKFAFAQQGASAGVYGSVLDAQGAAMPGAKVTLLHVTTNQVRTTTSDATGEFRFPLLPVGEYKITVEHPGFKKHEQTGLLLQVNDEISIFSP